MLRADLGNSIAQQRQSLASKDIRVQFGASMTALAGERADLLAITADLMYATGMSGFGARYPERLINVGIAEQNMTGVAAGLASCGKLPVVCGYAAFTTLRAAEQAKVDCAYNNLKVILIGQSSGLSYGVGGPSHQTFEDVAIMRAIPNMKVVVASDAIEVDQALHACVASEVSGPIYLRLGRGPEHLVNDVEEPFEIGRARVLRKGSDLCIVANGPMVAEAVMAADALAGLGIGATVLNMHTVKPIDRDAILAAAAYVRGMIVIEEHNVHGGLGSAVLEALRDGHSFPVRLIGIEDFYPPIGPTAELRASLGLSAENVCRQALEMLGAVTGGPD